MSDPSLPVRVAQLITESEHLLAQCPFDHSMRNEAFLIGLLSGTNAADLATIITCVERMRAIAEKSAGA